MLSSLTHPAILGTAMVVTFMTLIMTRRMSAATALLAVPIVFGLLAGAGPRLGDMILQGVGQVAPTALLLSFAVLYFALMMDAGLFAPLVRGILSLVGRDPVRISLGTAGLSMAVSLDGDGTSSALIVISAFLPIYRRVGMNPLILATLLGLSSALMNLLPWGGPAARAAAALHVDLAGVVGPLLPAMGAGLATVFLLAWMFGRGERRRLGWAPEGPSESVLTTVDLSEDAQAALRPRLLWFNLALTVALLVGMIAGLAPLPVLMMAAFAIAASINYPRLADQRARIAAHAGNVVQVVLLIFAAGAFTGILNGTGMADAMASAALSVIPPQVGPSMALVAGLTSLPLTFVMSNDAYYFGVVPVVAKAAAEFGIEPVFIARASLVGLPVHTLSPLLAPIYLACGLLGVDVADAQRFALRWAVLVSLVLLAVGGLTGAIPWRV
jgi:CitMHS family citrate-Mg2+:H+ or citrate-Ca2+:H+ symporter